VRALVALGVGLTWFGAVGPALGNRVRQLRAEAARSPSVVVLGRDTLQAPGAVADDPAARLAETLPSGGWLGVVCGLDDLTVGLLRPWVATRDGDGWQLEQT